MYYPIIDKLKELMTDITSVKEKEPLVIEGTVTGAGGGNWTGNWNDILSASNTNKPIYFSVTVGDSKFSIPVISVDLHSADSGIIYFSQRLSYGQIEPNNTFHLYPIQQG